MTKQTPPNPRELMEMAVRVMRNSVHEPREDKASPAVGAVLIKSDGTIETACRGELRDGDHAEYTLLERKNRSERLDGSILFATLEPCAPGARKPPKCSCAERIVVARIKEVWVGIEDPDPKVDRKGIKYLQDHGVKVTMFDRDLQEKIREANAEFIAGAADRAASEKTKPAPVRLSELEEPKAGAVLTDFSEEALTRYRDAAKINEPPNSAGFARKLALQGVLKEVKGEFVPTGFGYLLFGERPRTGMPQAGLLATVHHANGTEETGDFDGPMVLIPDQVEEWLGNKLPSTLDRNRMRRSKAVDVPFSLIREGVVNALVHRDYTIAGAKCQLVVTPDTVTVKSPGGPLPPVTLAQLQSFSAPMLSRNPQLHYAFATMDLAEERGLGMKTFRLEPEKHHLPLPSYRFEDPYLVLTLYRSPESASRTLSPSIAGAMNQDEHRGWAYLSASEKVSQAEYARHLKIETRQAQRHLKKFVELGLLRRVGSGPVTFYQVVR